MKFSIYLTNFKNSKIINKNNKQPLYHVVLPCILIKNNRNDIFSQINVKDLRQINAKRKRLVYIVCIYVYMMVNIVYTPYSSFSSKWVFTLVLLAEMRLDDFVFFLILYSFILRLSSSKIAMRCNFWSSHRPFFFVVGVTILCLIYIQRINLKWDDKEKNKRSIRQICLCMLKNVIINIQLLDNIIEFM